MLMRSRTNGHCETCGGVIVVGSLVVWSHDYGAHHPQCWRDDGADRLASALADVMDDGSPDSPDQSGPPPNDQK